MTTTHTYAVFCWFVATTAMLPSGAEEGKPDRSDRIRKLLLKRFDKDRNKQLDRRELESLRSELAKRGLRSDRISTPGGLDKYLREFDSSGDGALDEQEIKRAQSSGNLPAELTDGQLRLLEKAESAYEALEEAKETGRSVQLALPEAVALALLAFIPAGFVLSLFHRMHENRGWRRPTWGFFWVLYGVVFVVVVWAYFAFVPEVW